ncbi:MAG TPA: FecR domain-containing protein, partial [Pseudomonas sp.]|nr:FecR domain-containing protein [Pseudomonas sp.]
ERFTLDDGSQLNLNAGTAVDLDFTASQRLLHLRHGELVVQVAADAKRPFIVRTAQGDIRALGTRFLVRQEANATRVIVLEHAVRLTLRDGSQRLDLQQNDAALLRPQRIDALGPGQVHRADWLDGRLNVLDEPLGDVVDALRPYQAGLIRVSPEIRDLRVQGVFLLDDPQRTLTALAETLPIRVDRYGPWLTLLGPRG